MKKDGQLFQVQNLTTRPLDVLQAESHEALAFLPKEKKQVGQLSDHMKDLEAQGILSIEQD